MKNRKPASPELPTSLISRMNSFLWWSAGIYVPAASKIPHYGNKLGAIGLSNLTSSLFVVISSTYFGSLLFNNIVISLLLGLSLGIGTFNVTRFSVEAILSAGFERYRTAKKLLYICLGLALCIGSSLVVAFPLILLIFESEIQAHYQVAHPGGEMSFLDYVSSFEELAASRPLVILFSIIIALLYLLLELIPILVTIFLPPYDRSLYLEFLFSDINNMLTNRRFLEDGRKSQSPEVNDFGAIEFYIDYKKLTLAEINSLFHSIGEIYTMIYIVQNSLEFQFKKVGLDNYRIPSSRPEDILSLASIETGNSITFKISTGWKPDFKTINGNIVISLPKGALGLLVTGYLLTRIFDYGLSSYKEILEIQQIRSQNSKASREKLEQEFRYFVFGLDSMPPGFKEEFNDKVVNFYELTLGNSNFREIRVIQDPNVLNKIERGQVANIGEKR